MHARFHTCGVIWIIGAVHIDKCDSLLTKHFLCEKDGEKDYVHTGGHGALGIVFSRPRNTSIHFTHVICPSGYWTHEFLACDLQSVCWGSNSFDKTSGSEERIKIRAQCQSLLSTMFTCRKSAEYVPYSLVCDHSHDCIDASDEDFCFYPSCLSNLQFECTNKQVKKTQQQPTTAKTKTKKTHKKQIHKDKSKQMTIPFYSTLGCVLHCRR